MDLNEDRRKNREYMAEYRQRPGMKERASQYHRKYAAKHPEKIKQIARKKQLSQYGLTVDQVRGHP